MIATALGAKLGATLGGVAAGLAGVTTVVLVSTHVAGSPPAAHGIPGPGQARPAAVGATTPGTTPHPSATAQGPDANGPAKHGLCTAWKARTKHGNQSAGAEHSVAYQNLVKAAGGADRLAAFCADVATPGASGDKGRHGVGKPSGKGTGKRTDKSAKPGKPGNSKAGEPTGTRGGDSSAEPRETESGQPDGAGTEDSSPTPGTARTGATPHSRTGTPVPPGATPSFPSPTTIP
ncbi:hypothetical protein [Terrabacter sp. NPDC080008]|uniref:hypothetical protein n=1 Tax=Terrabacter sp. NPDC080008 TaxID=3155176 RepID=UPI00344E2462